VTEKALNHGAVILIAEDEPPLLELFRKILQSAGYQVLTAQDGKKALKIAEQHTEKIDLLLSDVVMPEMSGVELAKALKSKRPESRIILTSAYDQGMLVMNSGWHFIQKPYLPQRLLEEVQKALSIPPEQFKPEEHE
jgi:two-component system, cell cycle sensor histidine kinase and response regulator CckA